MEVCHSLIDWLDAVAHRKLIDNLLRRFVEVDFPRIVALRLRQFHETAVLLAKVVENVLVKASVLDMIRRDLLLAFNLHGNVKTNRSRDGRLVCSLLEIVPHIHLARQRSHLDDCLTQEVVGLSRELLTKLRLEIVVLVPNAHFDAIR